MVLTAISTSKTTAGLQMAQGQPHSGQFLHSLQIHQRWLLFCIVINLSEKELEMEMALRFGFTNWKTEFRPCLINSGMPNGEKILLLGKAKTFRNTLCIARKLDDVWREKTRPDIF